MDNLPKTKIPWVYPHSGKKGGNIAQEPTSRNLKANGQTVPQLLDQNRVSYHNSRQRNHPQNNKGNLTCRNKKHLITIIPNCVYCPDVLNKRTQRSKATKKISIILDSWCKAFFVASSCPHNENDDENKELLILRVSVVHQPEY